MFGLPVSTHLGSRIPKTQLLSEMGANTALRKLYAEQIVSITWSEKLARETINLAPGQTVREIQIFEIETTTTTPDEKLLNLIDKTIPYHILYVLKCDDKCCARISYKDITPNAAVTDARVVVSGVYQTSWTTEDKLPCRVEGLDLDSVYENFVRQIAGGRLTTKEDESIQESVDNSKRREKLQKKIDALRKKIGREKQFNRQIELRDEMKELEKQLAEL